jgi:queuine tRNA-ribosyltransferase
MFTLEKSTPLGRTGSLRTAHGTLATPFFMPVATAGAMKGISFEQLLSLGAEVLLCNTYHLHLQPGEDVVEQAGGLHSFVRWNKPILTDSGGFQVFSLSGIRKLTDDGVEFRNHRSGAPLFIGPKESITIQHKLGADIIMCFDECPPSTAPRADQVSAVDRTLRWAKVCKDTHEQLKAERAKKAGTSANLSSLPNLPAVSPLLFGIVQGGLERDLREKCTQELIAIGFDGYAIGGLAVGETQDQMYDILQCVCPILPDDKPRYLMGVGELHQHREAVRLGIDMFDCVSCMREARHGNVWLKNGEKIRILRAEYKTDHTPIDADSPAPFSREHGKSYLHHLLKLGERYGETIACMQNMAVTLDTMKKLREEIQSLN